MDCVCPYCDKRVEDPDDCYESGVKYFHECQHCGKSFVFEIEYSREYNTRKALCLNGGKHDYQKTHTFPKKYAVMECTICGDRL